MQFMSRLHCLRVQIVGAFPKQTIFEPPLLLPHLVFYTLHLYPFLTRVFMHQIHHLQGYRLSTTIPPPTVLSQSLQHASQLPSHSLCLTINYLTHLPKVLSLKQMEIGAFILLMEVSIDAKQLPLTIYAVSEVLSHLRHQLRTFDGTSGRTDSAGNYQGRAMQAKGIPLRADCHHRFSFLGGERYLPPCHL